MKRYMYRAVKVGPMLFWATFKKMLSRTRDTALSTE
jgi:hypothetical protein